MRACLVSTWGPTPKKYIASFLSTAKRHGLEPQNFDDTDWPGANWREIPWWRKSEGQARFVREHASEYDVFMFTDSYDVVWAAGWTEILEKFQKLNSPIVFGAECWCWPDQTQAVLYPPTPDRCRFLNAGFWISTTEAAVPFTEELAKIAALREKDDQQIVVDMFLSGRHPIVLDTACSLCFCCNLDSLDYLDLSDWRPKTKDTGEQPCMFHANGGSDLRGVCAALDRWRPRLEEAERLSDGA